MQDIAVNPARQIDPEALGAFQSAFRGTIIRPADASYDEARRLWNNLIDKRPAIIARCAGTADVVACIEFAKQQGVPLSVRGGGHNVSGSALVDDGLTIDLSQMRAVRVDHAAQTVHVQGGATLGDIDAETQLFGLMTTTGNISATGVAGLTLNGGMGRTRRKHGLSVDNLVSVDLVTANGQPLHASERENPDLFWAVRGGGGNFGVVTSFEFRLHALGPEVYAANQFFAIADAPAAFLRWRDFVEAAPDEISSVAFFWTIPRIDAFPSELQGQRIFLHDTLFAGDAAEGERALAPLQSIGTPLIEMSGRKSYAALQRAFDPFFSHGPIYPQFYAYWKSIYLRGLDAAAIDQIVASANALPSEEALIAVWRLGGAIARVAEDATAFGKRNAPYMLSFDTSWTDPSVEEKAIAWTRAQVEAARRFSAGGSYLNFPGVGEDAEVLVREAYGANYARLAEIKRKHDPEDLFRMNQNIRPA